MLESSALGIATKKDAADERFCRFNALIQASAAKSGCVFFHGAADGNHEIETDEISGDDIDGWLVPRELVSEFKADWVPGELSQGSRWEPFERTAEWSAGSNGIDVTFVNYND